MTISDILYFKEAHKKVTTYKLCSPEVIRAYTGVLPEILLETWKESGFQSFSDGFLWSVNPDEFRDVAKDFVTEYRIEKVHVIFRTAFGDLIIFYENRYYHICVVTMRHAELSGSFKSILEVYLAEKHALKDIFFFDLFKKAKKKLGELKDEQVYGFFPALALGGDFDVSNLQKVNLRAHLYFLSQL